MANSVIFGILIVAIVAFGARAITTVLDNIIQNASVQIKKMLGRFPP